MLKPIIIEHIQNFQQHGEEILEEAASVFMQFILQKRALAIRNCPPRKFCMPLSTFLCAVDGSSLFLKCRSLYSKKQIRRQLQNIPKALLNVTEGAEDDLQMPTVQESFSVFMCQEKRGVWSCFDNVEIAAASPRQFNKLARLSTDISFAAMSLIRQSAKFYMLLDAEAFCRLIASCNTSITGDNATCLLEYSGAVFEGLIQLRGEKFSFTILKEVTNMESNDPKFRTILTLGEVEMSLDDIIKLRPGAVLRFKKPEVFEGSMRIGEYNWARVQLDIVGDDIRLSVREVGPSKEKLMPSSQQVSLPEL